MPCPQNVSLFLIRVFYKSQRHVVKIYMFVGCFSHSNPMTMDFPYGRVLDFGFPNLENMVPAASFHIRRISEETDQF